MDGHNAAQPLHGILNSKKPCSPDTCCNTDVPPPSFQLKEAGQRPHKEQLRTEKDTHSWSLRWLLLMGMRLLFEMNDVLELTLVNNYITL